MMKKLLYTFLLICGLSTTSQAANQYWDGSTNAGYQHTNSSWIQSTSISNWNAIGGTGPLSSWTGGNVAFFAATGSASTVTIIGAVTSAAVNISAGAYTYTLVITNGAKLYCNGMAWAGNTNSIVLSGTGSLLDDVGITEFGVASVGAYVTISNGAKIISHNSGIVGYSTGARNNTLIIDGVGSLWQVADTVNIGSVGSCANNTLIVTNGGSFSVLATGTQLIGSNETLLVSGTTSTYTNKGYLYVGYGNSSNCAVIINNGAKFYSTNQLDSTGEQASDKYCSLLITDPGTLYTNNYRLVSGHRGMLNTITVANGATLNLGQSLEVGGEIGDDTGSTNTALITDTGTTVNCGAAIYVGCGLGNTLIVSNGASVYSHGCTIGYKTPTYANGSNSMFVIGTNTLFDNGGAAFAIGRGVTFSNSLTISSGGSVDNVSSFSGSTNNYLYILGGTLGASNLVCTNFTTIGDGVQTATLKNLGGTFNFTNGALFLSNAVVRGSGTILGGRAGIVFTNGAIVEADLDLPGTINLGSSTFYGGAIVHADILNVYGTNGVGWDYINLPTNNIYTFTPNGLKYTVQMDSVTGLAAALPVQYSIPFMNVYTSSVNVADWTVDTTTFKPKGTWSVTTSNNLLWLTGTPSSNAYPYSLKIQTVGYNKTETLTNFSILVALNNLIPNFNYANFAYTNGSDLRFMNSNSTVELNYEIENWNTNGTSYVWVQVPTISSSSDYIYCYYGATNASTFPAYTTNGATWSANYQAVWHMNQTNAINSVASGSLNGQASGTVTQVTGYIDGADNIPNSASALINVGTSGLITTNALSVSAWFKANAVGGVVHMIVGEGNDGGYGGGLDFFITTDSKVRMYPQDALVARADSATTIVTGQWYYAVATFDKTSTKMYINGILESNCIDGVQSARSATTMFLGNYKLAAIPFNGQIDEVRISTVARSTNWAWASWSNQVSGSTFLNYGAVTNGYRNSLKIQTLGYNKTGTLTNFPILVALSTNISGFSYTNFSYTNGTDIRFTDSSSSQELNFEIDQWNTNGTSLFWVQVPIISDTNSYFYCYYGSKTASLLPVYTTNGSTWAANYGAVWHLSQTSGNMLDSTTNGLSITLAGDTTRSATGTVGKALIFGGANGYGTFPYSAGMALTNNFTAELWVQEQENKWMGFFGRRLEVPQAGWMMSEPSAGNNYGVNLAPGGFQSSDNGHTNDFVWRHLGFKMENQRAYLFVDGVQQATSNYVAFTDAGVGKGGTVGTFYIDDLTAFFFHGLMDEIRFSTTSRSTNWVWASYSNQVPNSTFLQYGTTTNITPSVVTPVGNLKIPKYKNSLKALNIFWPMP